MRRSTSSMPSSVSAAPGSAVSRTTAIFPGRPVSPRSSAEGRSSPRALNTRGLTRRKATRIIRSRAAAPDVSETISYQMPAFKDHGRLLVSYAAFKGHCSLFPMSRKVIETYAEELKPYLSGKGTIRFRPDDPLPAMLVQKIVKARIEENAARRRS